LLIYESGAGPNCFTAGQAITVGYNLRMVSPTAGSFSASSPTFDVFDSAGANGLVIQASAADGFSGNNHLETVVSISILRAGIAASGDFAQTSACGAVAPGATCVVQVTFTPSALGARAGSLTINDNAPGNPHTVALNGSGTAGAAPAIAALVPSRGPAGAAGL